MTRPTTATGQGSMSGRSVHWGALILPRGYVNTALVERTGGNPYGVSVSLERVEAEPEFFAGVLDTARFQGGRLAALAAALATNPEVTV